MAHDHTEKTSLPQFSKIQISEIVPGLTKLLSEYQDKLEEVLSYQKTHTWETLVAPLELMEDKVSRAFAPISHLNGVKNSSELKQAYDASIAKLTAFYTEKGQNKELFQALKTFSASSEFEGLTNAQKNIVRHALRDFKLAGVELSEDKQKRFKGIEAELSKLSSDFAQNVLEATQAWQYFVPEEEEAQLSGVPEHACAQAKAKAGESDRAGYTLTLDMPCYIAVITHADNRDIREKIYHAYQTKASTEAAHDAKLDNGPLIEKIVRLRQEKAALLGFKSYSELSLQPKMAENPEQVIEFLEDLARKSKPFAEKEFKQLEQYAKERDGLSALRAWDVAYYSEKYKQEHFDISEEALRAYFPENKVLTGMFELVEKLYDIKIEEVKDFDSWVDTARLFDVKDKQGTRIGQFYADLYAREQKRSGAWCADCVSRMKKSDGNIQVPVAFLVTNFSSPTDGHAYFTHDEVITLFHEFGHTLHHILTTVDFLSAAGHNGVAWDAIELPSQFMENWCWEKSVLQRMTEHKETKQPLPDDLFDKLIETKTYLAAMQMIRQIEFALFDFKLHSQTKALDESAVQAILDEVRDAYAVVKTPAYNKFQNSFSHIFAGGYAAGYYSYKWAEVLSADAYAKFEEEGLMNEQVGKAFKEHILEKGSSQEPMELFVKFRGRKPSIQPLLIHNGLEVIEAS